MVFERENSTEMAKAPQKRTAKLKYFDVARDLMWIQLRRTVTPKPLNPHP